MRFSLVLRNGLVAGAAAGLSAALVLWVLVEPVIRRALVIEEARESGGHHGEDPLVSRTLQVLVGGVTAAAVGVLFGLVFAVVFAKARHRLLGATDLGRACWLALFGFGAFVLLPALKIPANPPAVGDPDTVTERTLIYVLSILVGLLVIGAVSGIDRVLHGRVDTSVRAALDAVSAIVLVGLALWLIPSTPDGIASDVPADLIWDFRIASLAQLGAMWAVLGLAFGVLSTRDWEKVPVVTHASSL